MEVLTTNKESVLVFKKYIAWLYRLVVEEKNNFDLIIAPADSGTFIAEAARMFYTTIKKRAPKIVVLPILRYKKLGIDTGKHYDNSTLLPQVSKELAGLKRLKSVLFVDDEIALAYTAKEAIRLALDAVPKKIIANRVIYTILAENHAFEWRYDIPPVAIKYCAFSNKTKGVNGAIFEIIADKVWKKFQEVDSTISKKKIACLFSSGLIKAIEDGKPVLSNKILVTIKREILDFETYKENFLKYVKILIQQATEEYLDGDLKLRD